eukprot:CAMPEP_0115424566 /NCGR_PEP_ID=MMETSP0271-20121206/27914_1 /TAXON_ID=71861 /ORGANISM="Scrippsiella trochoidea, Strain CCMP3099" /LENGTH=33 /DNA_ID= /DNA_START= /DNA_END= /DNA_ORIENTATION=
MPCTGYKLGGQGARALLCERVADRGVRAEHEEE